MPSVDRPAPPSRWTRTLPWLAGLLIGTSAHVVWWSRAMHEPAVELADVPTPAPAVHVHVHSGERGQQVPSCEPPPRPATPTIPAGVRGAVVCSIHGCTIRRSFIRQLQQDPRMMGRGPWQLGPEPGGHAHLRVQGVFPGSVADVLGLRNGDAIIAIDGQPLPRSTPLLSPTAMLEATDGVTLTVRRRGAIEILRYVLVDR